MGAFHSPKSFIYDGVCHLAAGSLTWPAPALWAVTDPHQTPRIALVHFLPSARPSPSSPPGWCSFFLCGGLTPSSITSLFLLSFPCRPLSDTSSLSVLLRCVLVEEDLWARSRHSSPRKKIKNIERAPPQIPHPMLALLSAQNGAWLSAFSLAPPFSRSPLGVLSLF